MLYNISNDYSIVYKLHAEVNKIKHNGVTIKKVPETRNFT